jgi:hypothetical protein
MSLTVKCIFTAFLLNSILQIDCRSSRNLHYKRELDNDQKDETRQLFTELINGLKEDDRQIVYTIVQLTAIVESRSCIKDEDERKNGGGEFYNGYKDLYPMVQVQYRQLLEKLGTKDKAILKKMIETTKATVLERCQLLFDDNE